MSTLKSDNSDLTINADGSGKNIKLQANGSEKVVIKSDGKVGIGTTSPRGKLDLGAGSGDGTLSTTASQYQLILESPQGTGDLGRNIGFAVGTGTVNASINAVDVGTSDATGIAFSAGSAGAATERLRIDSDGLKFNGDTAAANALDDYETGTWTPQIYYQNTTDQANATNTTQTGKYTKIGNIIHLELRLIWTAGSSIVNDNIGVKNLPFSANSTLTYNAAGVGYAVSSTTTINTLLLSNPNTGTMSIFESGDYIGNLSNEFGSGAGKEVRCSLTYLTA